MQMITQSTLLHVYKVYAEDTGQDFKKYEQPCQDSAKAFQWFLGKD
jgi:hypothetical protein